MDNTEFGILVEALRNEHVERVNGRERVWSQKKLVQRVKQINPQTELTIDVLSNIERGQKAYIKGELLFDLANGLGLTPGEKEQFLLAPNGISSTDSTLTYESASTVLAKLLQDLEAVTLPSFIIDTYYDLVAVNESLLYLYQIAKQTRQKIRAQNIPLNVLDFVFDSIKFKKQQEMLSNREEYANHNLMLCRAYSLQYRATTRFKELLDRLINDIPRFRAYWHIRGWQQHPHQHWIDSGRMRLNHPNWNEELYYTCPRRSVLTKQGVFTQCIYTPMNTLTHKAFYEIHEIIDKETTKKAELSDWAKLMYKISC